MKFLETIQKSLRKAPAKKINEKKGSVLREWAEATTAHGFSDLAHAKTVYGRTIWIILISICTTIMCYQVFRAIKLFSGHEWTTNIKSSPADASGLPFPSITVCDVNRFKWSKVEEYNMTLDMLNFVLQTINPGGLLLDPNSTHMSTAIDKKSFTTWRLSHNFTFLSFFDAMAPSCKDLFVTDICDSMTVTVLPTDTLEYGRCQTVQYNTNQIDVGSKGGQKLMLDTQGWDYLPLVYNNYLYEGLMVQVTYDGNVQVGQWMKLYPGTHATISMQAVKTDLNQDKPSILNPFTYLQSKPPCERVPKLQFNETLQYPVTNCKLECIMSVTVKLCNCLPYKANESYRACEFEELDDCFFRINASFYDPEASVACANSCQQSCYNKYVQTQISMTKLPSHQQRGQFRDWLDSIGKQSVQIDDIIALEIFFNTLDTQIVEWNEVMSLDNLVSSSGGLIGLWAGMSFFTVFQAISYFIKYIEKTEVRKRLKDLQVISET